MCSDSAAEVHDHDEYVCAPRVQQKYMIMMSMCVL